MASDAEGWDTLQGYLVLSLAFFIWMAYLLCWLGYFLIGMVFLLMKIRITRHFDFDYQRHLMRKREDEGMQTLRSHYPPDISLPGRTRPKHHLKIVNSFLPSLHSSVRTGTASYQCLTQRHNNRTEYKGLTQELLQKYLQKVS